MSRQDRLKSTSRGGTRQGGAAVVALVGPTGSGKSAVALEVAERLGAEIVALDAFTVYRDMDVGTAKPSSAERARVPHHLVDALSPSEECSVEWFQRAGRAAIAAVTERGRLPLLVGGSGLYFRAVVDPLEFPPTDPGVRAALQGRYREAPAAAHAALSAVDPDAARRIDPENLRRTVRALEVIELTGRRFSDYRRGWDGYTSVYPDLRAVGIEVDRAQLGKRLDARVDAMLADGWLEEIARLRERSGGLSVTARQAIGYAELADHLAGEVDIDEAVRRIKSRTRRYAHRQQRWFAADPRVQWAAAPDAAQLLEDCAR